MGIENLQILSIELLQDTPEFTSYDAKKTSLHNALIPRKYFLNQSEGVKSVDIQRIGTIKEKETYLEVYNVHIQAIIEYSLWQDHKTIFSLSLGNSNPSGIPE